MRAAWNDGAPRSAASSRFDEKPVLRLRSPNRADSVLGAPVGLRNLAAEDEIAVLVMHHRNIDDHAPRAPGAILWTPIASPPKE